MNSNAATATPALPTPIERTPGIGPNLATELRTVGIDSLEALTRVGFWDAWQQLRRANPERDCLPACPYHALFLAPARYGRAAGTPMLASTARTEIARCADR